MPFFLRWARLAWEEHAREMSFRVYLTDAVRLTAENAAHIGGGSVMQVRWAETLDGRKPVEDTRDAEEIIADIAEKAGLTIL